MHVQRDLTNVYRAVLRSISEIWTSLQQNRDVDGLLQQIADATCQALGFRYSALYLEDEHHNFYVRATSSSVPAEHTAYLRQHPMPAYVASLLTQPALRCRNSYFIPGEADVWQDESVAAHFVIVQEGEPVITTLSYEELGVGEDISQWRPNDLLLVPLRKGDGSIIGFLTPDSPLDGLRPSPETVDVLEVFASQATGVIEWAHLYEEAQSSSQERAALIEIGRALSAPEALRDLSTVYQVLYAQLCRVMPVDGFFVTRCDFARDEMYADYIIDEDISYPSPEPQSPISPWIGYMLTEHLTYCFLTAQEHEDFVLQHTDRTKVILFGSKRRSESLIFVPVHYGDEAIGMLSVQSYQPHVYTQRHVQMIKEIAVQAGIAMMNARRYSELGQAMRQAQESEQLKNQFLMTASHELRTPLTAIQGYLELLSTHGAYLDEERKQRFIDNARRACDELVLLLGNVMDTSRIDQEWVSVKRDVVAISPAVAQILEILDPTITREQRHIELDLADDLSVWADDLRLRQVLMNLVGNALKYTPPATQIAIGAQRLSCNETLRRIEEAQPGGVNMLTGERCVLIWVRDWGPGISQKEQEKLFTKFSRLSTEATQAQRGAGWGLYLCRKLVEAMNGSIWVESQGIPGEGSTFLIALPETEGQ
ncbi:ATP-binding protein [Ktedonobacter sp. SOSP1-85]|uniref:GAF domain-containing sensor histidine kinase n=1 Tax=Ktedonobacter sp. SOSP1-85 TaxID=2778367 RepID=UPI001915AB82|nr:ATP-binding protein [Ktedonobacter sp. SOSP1-85]